MRTSRRLEVSLLAAALVLCAGAASAQSYGLGDQVLTVGAASFHPEVFANTFGGIDNDGYMYSTAKGTASFIAPLDLPDGAAITGVCFDTDQGAPGSTLHVQLQAITLPGTGEDFFVLEIPGSAIVATGATGYAHACTSDPIAYTVRESADLNGNGARHLAHRVHVSIDPGTAFGAVRVTWHRQVSPAPGSATFADVPASDGAFAFVEALVASGVTAGCGNGNYCPDAPITRRQMAVFLSKALGLHWTD